MKLAFANAGLWFFGTIIFCAIFGIGGFDWKNQHDVVVRCLIFLAIAFVVAAARFFYVWYEYEEAKLRLEHAKSKADDQQ